jgi:hypothetical protein
MTESSLNQNRKNPTKNATEPGDAGSPSAPSPASALTPSSRIPEPEKELFIRAFLALYRVAQWHQSGSLLGQRPRPVVSSTVRDAAGHLAASFQSHFQPSPFHLEESFQLLPTVRSLLKAFHNADPCPNVKKRSPESSSETFTNCSRGKQDRPNTQLTPKPPT